WDLVDDGFTEPTIQVAYNVVSQYEKKLLNENRKTDCNAFLIIQQAIDELILLVVAVTKCSKQASH
ncbi:hypothetical protein KI387_012385, partial [Taxus chinensis]